MKDEEGKIDFEFISPEQPIRNHFFINYTQQLQAGLMMGIDAALNKEEYRVLLFGYPGSGKSEYPYELLNYLRKLGFKYVLMYIRCNRITSRYDNPSEIKSWLRQHTEEIKKYDFKMLIFDEFDSISPRRFFLPSQRELSLWTMSFLANGTKVGKKTLIFGITNFPLDVDEAVRDRLQYYLFFDFPDKEVITSILSYFEIPQPKEVAKNISSLLVQEQYGVTGRGLVFACKKIKKLDTLENKTPEEIADLILNHVQPVPKKDIDKYYKQNSIFIKYAHRNINYWSKKYIDFSKKHTNLHL